MSEENQKGKAKIVAWLYCILPPLLLFLLLLLVYRLKLASICRKIFYHVSQMMVLYLTALALCAVTPVELNITFTFVFIFYIYLYIYILGGMTEKVWIMFGRQLVAFAIRVSSNLYEGLQRVMRNMFNKRQIYSTKNVNKPTFNAPGISGNNYETTINNTNTTTFVTNNGGTVERRPKFRGEALKQYMRGMELKYMDMEGKRRPITNQMLWNIPLIREITFEGAIKTLQHKGYTSLYQLFPKDKPERKKRLIAFNGQAGSGKSVFVQLLHLFTIKSDNVPFLIVFKDLNNKEDLRFAELVKKYACSDFPIGDVDGFHEWLCENSHVISFLLDGLDEASFCLSEKFTRVHIDDTASPATWIKNLFAGMIMPQSTIIFTSRPSSVAKLPIICRPDSFYSLNGFEGESMRHAIQIYCDSDSDCDEIVSFIDSIAAEDNHFLRSPFVIALIAIIYQSSSREITPDSTLTQLYKLAFEKRRSSNHYLQLPTDEENNGIQKCVDKFIHDRFMQNNLGSFTQEELEKNDLRTVHVDNESFITVHRKTSASHFENKDVVIEVKHLTVAEFHSARHIIKIDDMETFRETIEDLFKLENQDRKVMVRRFLSGLVCDSECPREKKIMFVEKLLENMKYLMSSQSEYSMSKRPIFGFYSPEEGRILTYLLNDISELDNEAMELVRNKFSSGEGLRIQYVELEDIQLVNGLTKFIRKVDPNLKNLHLILSESVDVDHFSKIVVAIVNLTRKVGCMSISNIQLHVSHKEELKKLMMKTDEELELVFNDIVEEYDIVQVKKSLQLATGMETNTKTYVTLDHRGRTAYLRSITSPLIMEYDADDDNKTVNLARYGQEPPERAEAEIREHRELRFDFIISEYDDVVNFTTLIAASPYIKILLLRVILPDEMTRICMREFCENISKLDNKVEEIDLHYVTESVVDVNDIKRLMEGTERCLQLFYPDDVNGKDELEKELVSFHKLLQTPDLEVTLSFNTSSNVVTKIKIHES